MAPEPGLDQRTRVAVARWADVVVVGGGPAGSVTAALLARQGVQVALVHAEPERELAVGEVLPPPARPVLERLGLGAVLDDPAHLVSPGNVSLWGSDVPRASDFLYSPYGNGLHLERACFDAGLRDLASAAGARVVPGRWDVRGGAMATDLGPIRVMVDATGRASALARADGASSENLDRLLAVAGVLTPRNPGVDVDARTYVAAVLDGWWYSALLPDGRRVAAFHTDADLLPVAMRRDPGTWHAALLMAPGIGELVQASGAPPSGTLHVLAADSRRLLPALSSAAPAAPADTAATAAEAATAALVVVGDAGMAFDPLSSQGILSAIQSAEEATTEVIVLLGADAAAIAVASRARADAQEGRWTRYTERLAAAYWDEHRWPDVQFWERRHAWSAALDSG